jgi:hypothetical protein
MKSALVAAAFLLLAQQVPPPGPPPTSPKPAAEAPLPVLPRDAKLVVEQTTRQMLQQLQMLHDRYMFDQRADDAAAVRAQIKLLQKATGVTDDPSAADRPKVVIANYRDRVGQTFVFTVTGSADEPVWGTGIYTDDTALEGAAVHAGVLRSGQTGDVRVTVLPGQARYEGSKRNGIESGAAGFAGGSYRFDNGSGTSSAARPTSIGSFRGRVGEVLIVPVVGSATGSVWGSDIYTDDSQLAAAVVHAGLLEAGEFGFVKVTMVAGLEAYWGSTRNGVKTSDYGAFQGSYQVAMAPKPWAIKLPDDVEDASGMIQLQQLRKHQGVSFSVKVTGATGAVRGTGVYTDDSSIAAAAVHAGVLRLGEKGYVLVTVLGAQDAYVGVEQNGIKSSDAAKALGSFRVDRSSGPR